MQDRGQPCVRFEIRLQHRKCRWDQLQSHGQHSRIVRSHYPPRSHGYLSIRSRGGMTGLIPVAMKWTGASCATHQSQRGGNRSRTTTGQGLPGASPRWGASWIHANCRHQGGDFQPERSVGVPAAADRWRWDPALERTAGRHVCSPCPPSDPPDVQHHGPVMRVCDEVAGRDVQGSAISITAPGEDRRSKRLMSVNHPELIGLSLGSPPEKLQIQLLHPQQSLHHPFRTPGVSTHELT